MSLQVEYNLNLVSISPRHRGHWLRVRKCLPTMAFEHELQNGECPHGTSAQHSSPFSMSIFTRQTGHLPPRDAVGVCMPSLSSSVVSTSLLASLLVSFSSGTILIPACVLKHLLWYLNSYPYHTYSRLHGWRYVYPYFSLSLADRASTRSVDNNNPNT